jgi:hypothetical protein
LGVLLAAAACWFNPLAMTTDALVEVGQIESVASTPFWMSSALFFPVFWV